MSPARVRLPELARVTIELVLASFACWLVIQNVLLLALDPWSERPAALVASAAIFKAGAHVAVVVWPWLVFAAIGFGVAAGLLAARVVSGRRAGGVS